MTKPLSRKYGSDYASDDGFVEDGAPKSKKQKSKQQQQQQRGEGFASASKAMGKAQKDDEGNEYWELSGKRRVQVSQFKNATFVGIREFYEKDGAMLPGKKGISLSIDQYKSFIELIPEIEAVLGERGIEVPRPQYSASSSSTVGNGKRKSESDEDDDENDEGDEDEQEQARGPKSKSKLDKFRMKANHEATSDEEED